MKKWISVIAVIVLALGIVQPAESFAKQKTMDQIDKELKELKEQAAEAQAKQEQAEKDGQVAQHYVNKNTNYLNDLLAQIQTVSSELANISKQISDSEEQLRQTAKKLDETEQRIEERSKLLDNRVRLMYTDGAVSYLDVVMSSTSFTDFLDRIDSITAIANQDKELLAEHKKDKELVLQQQKELEAGYAKTKQLYAEAESRKQVLSDKEDEKQQLIAQYSDQVEESDDISEEQDKLLVELVSKQAALEQEKNKLKAQQIYTYKKQQAAKKAAEAAAAAKSSSSSSSSSSGSYTTGDGSLGLPVGHARISSPFGYRIHPITGVKKLHAGVDFAVPIGTDVHAAEGGVVVLAEWYSGYGNCVIIDHGDNTWTVYGHLSEFKVEKGDTVKRGEVVAESGNTGQSTGPHMHFEVRVNGEPTDPMPYLAY
ncbi:murein hydrolase activator EnvC family protein [Paenibacillus pinistramenti]|uniref:murein hydrolase activator EnvC family protein n=1 Tax=Paenibacillus pinistramenti TaxID=1768003 RepID=UPI0011092BEE|nr:peptidoglycan DD-metalloendopeptidase family protein [Paenibacillus pinistramenti]